MISSLNKNLLSKAKFLWKTLVVLILSVLLVAPTPALALDYNGTLQTYVSNTKVEIDGVLTSIKKLPSQSYENGKTTLAEIDSKLHKIQSDAGKNAKIFQNLSYKHQEEYEQIFNRIKDFELKYPKISETFKLVDFEKIPIKQRLNMLQLIPFPTSEIKDDFWFQMTFENQKQRLANTIVLTNKVSQLCDRLEKRVNLAKQKSGNVNDYAEVLNSFSDPDILSEIAELNTFVANLTKNLTLAS